MAGMAAARAAQHVRAAQAYNDSHPDVTAPGYKEAQEAEKRKEDMMEAILDVSGPVRGRWNVERSVLMVMAV